MKKILAGAVSGAAALTVMFGAGPASADNEYQGLTYAKVQQSTGNRAVISSRVGSYLPTEECIVTGNRRASFLDSSGNSSRKILVDLNCNDKTAANGHPGTSQTKLDKQLVKRLGQAKQISGDFAQATADGKPPYCAKGEDENAACIRICRDAGTCSTELEDFLGL